MSTLAIALICLAFFSGFSCCALLGTNRNGRAEWKLRILLAAVRDVETMPSPAAESLRAILAIVEEDE